MMRRIEVELSVVIFKLIFIKKLVMIISFTCNCVCQCHIIYCDEVMVRFQHSYERRRHRGGLHVMSDKQLLTRTGTSRIQDTVSLFRAFDV